jgi:hypothetical protein
MLLVCFERFAQASNTPKLLELGHVLVLQGPTTATAELLYKPSTAMFHHMRLPESPTSLHLNKSDGLTP